MALLLLSLAACGGAGAGSSASTSAEPAASHPQEQEHGERAPAAHPEASASAAATELAARPPLASDLPEPAIGPEDAPVVVEIFSDFECPYCAMARAHTARLLADFEGEVRIIYRNYPLSVHPHAQHAAEAALDALEQGGPEAFWRYHELLFEHQRELSRETLLRLAREAGVDPALVGQALDSGRHRDRVQRDRDAGEALGVQGTPSFVVNGQLLESSDYLALEEAVDVALLSN
jgi:protein-disulfide isomerase